MARLFNWDDEPPEEAYSRLTSPERFGVLVDAAAALVAQLLDRFDVRREAADARDAGCAGVDVVRADRLVPADPRAAPLVVEVSAFPGVALRAGYWFKSGYPRCGFDACDDDPDELVAQLRDDVAAVVGGFTEELERTPVRRVSGRLPFPAEEAIAVQRQWLGGRLAESGVLAEDELDQLLRRGPEGVHRWQPWPRRPVDRPW
ncbi:MAG: DUF6226 family protein [Actinomycetota bacterium]|nr:DUF6226 family protein [Actinomycetota bacterium]